MRYTYSQPGNEHEFEDFCLRFYRHLLKNSALVRYGKRGEKQDGIDIIDPLGMKPFVAIQCKHREPTKTIEPQEIKDEVTLAETSPHPINRYIIATTAKKSRNAQDAVVELNQRQGRERPFAVEIHFWEEICGHLNEFRRAVAEFIFWGEPSGEVMREPVRGGAGGYPSAVAETSNQDVDLYADISELFVSRKVEAAEHEIDKLPDAEHDLTLSTRQRYGVLRLKAKLAIERLDFDEAARLFLLAYDTCPELQQARQNRVLAMELSGQREQAAEEAGRLLAHGIRSSFLVSLLIRNARDPSELAPYWGVVDEYTPSEEDVNLALVDGHLEWDQPELAEAAARRALDVAPKSAHALFRRGMVAHHLALQGDWRNRYERLGEAIKYYSQAIAAAERDKYVGLLPELYSNRGRAQAAGGDVHQAAQDFRKAVQASNRPGLYAQAAVSFFLNVQDYESARELLPTLDPTSDETAFLTAVTEYNHAPRDEKKEYILALQNLADRGIDRAVESRFLCVQWAIALKDFTLARNCVPQPFAERQPFQGNTLIAWIELEAGDEEHARESAAVALDSSSRAAHKQEIAVLARLLVRLGDDEKALPLLEQVATPGVLDDDCRRLVECAQRLDRHDILLRVSADLRETDKQDNVMRKLEVQLLSHYAPAQAFALAKEFIRFDKSYFSAASNFLACRLGDGSKIEFDEDHLPKPEEFDTEEAYLVVIPYIEAERYRDAIEFAYHQLRMRFSDERAHGQYIWLVLQYGRKADVPPALQVVDEESAVYLESVITGEKRWVVAEDRQPDLARNEYSCSTSVVRTLIGKRLGDTVELQGHSLQPQQERVAGIQPKYVHLFQDVISNFQRRFPGAGTIQAIHLVREGELDPSPWIESLKARQVHVLDAMEFYQNNLCSLHLLATRLGIDEHRLMKGLGAHDGWFVRCVECSPQQYSEAAQADGGTDKVVLDLSAIITLSRLSAWNKLDRQWTFLVSQATFDKVSHWLHLVETGNRPTSYSYLREDGKIGLEDLTDVQLQSERDEVQAMADGLRDLCAVRSSIALASLPPKRREQYKRVCGGETLESLGIATDEGALLWTDDLFVGVVAELDFGVKRVWTQLVFKRMENAKRIGSDVYSEITAKLAAWNYIATVWNPQDLIASGRLCNWNADEWPLKRCLRLIGTCPLPLPARARMAMEFFRLLRRSECIELKQSAVVQAVLDALGNASAVRWMLARLDQFFRIDFFSAQFLGLELSYWLGLR